MSSNVPPKLLIVDDHAALRGTVRQLFAGARITVLEAASGEEAVAVFGSEHPDWVIMDLRMPGMGGLKATEAIQRINPQAQVIILSQFNEPEYAELARQAGAMEFVNKENMGRLVEIVCDPSAPQP